MRNQQVASIEARDQAEYWKQLKKKHDEVDQHSEILLMRRELSSQDLKALMVFAEHFGLDVNVRGNLAGNVTYLGGGQGLMISISKPPFS